jgi:hypothetical protein
MANVAILFTDSPGNEISIVYKLGFPLRQAPVHLLFCPIDLPDCHWYWPQTAP